MPAEPERARVARPVDYGWDSLPRCTPGMVGRDFERRRIIASLERTAPAVVSITGVAGSGKTTLAAAASETLVEERGWGVAWIDVVSEPSGRSLSLALQGWLGVDDLEPSTLKLATSGRRVVVVLDGADGRLDEIAEALASLEDVPAVRVILTSIQGIRGPNVVPVPIGGLGLPPIDASESDLAKYPSVELFMSVANAGNPGLIRDDRMLSDAAQVCRALDGLPLAVKLAAGRLGRPLSSTARMSRLAQTDPMFALMVSDGGSDAGSPDHQLSVRRALSWTYSLLDQTQQQVLRRSCVFRAPFGLDALERVCEMSRYSILEPLEDLTSLHLLEVSSDEVADIRFETHPLVRAFGTEALVEAGEERRCRDLHAGFFSNLARTASGLFDQCHYQADVELRTLEPDLYAALDHLIETGEVLQAMRLAADLGHLAYEAGHCRDLLTRLDGLLSNTASDSDASVAADALLWAAELELQTMTSPDTVEHSRQRWHQGMTLAKAEGEPLRILRGLAGGVRAVPVTGDFARAKAAAEEGLSLAREVGNAAWLARFTAWSGMIAHQERDFATAARLATQGLGIALRSSDRRALMLLAMLVAGMPEEHSPELPLLPPLEELYAVAVDLGDREGQSWLLGQLASHAVKRGDYQSAASWVLLRVDLVRGSRAWHALGFSLMGSVSVLAHFGHPKLAARVHGSLTPIMRVLVGALGAQDESAYASTVFHLEAVLGGDVFQEQVRAGAGEAWADVLLSVVPVLREAASSRRPRTSPLTDREAEVLSLLSEGMSNKDIANRLRLSPKTVMHHTVSIYRKLGVRGRSEAATTAIRRGLIEP